MRKNKKVIELMKDELGGKIMIDQFVAFRPKTYSYLTDKKANSTKKSVMK